MVFRALVLLALASGCARVEPVRDCRASGAARPVCGFQNPEDLVVLPSGKKLLVSEFGNIEGTRPGRLVVFDLASDARTVAFSGGDATVAPPGERWGDASCPGPPSAAFSPHGIDLARRHDGRLALLAVNHGGRESVEFFEVTDGEHPTVTWRGCAIPPPDSFLNEVAILPDGGFVTTHMFARSTSYLRLALAYLFGSDTGYVFEWQPGHGFARMPGTSAGFPNGIAVAADGKSIYLDATMSRTVRRIERGTGKELARAAVEGPDNVIWGHGRLLVASIRASFAQIMACNDLREGACPTPFAIVALDPETLAQTELYANAGPPMGGGTAAVEVGDELVIGSFAGDRLLRVRMPQQAAGAHR